MAKPDNSFLRFVQTQLGRHGFSGANTPAKRSQAISAFQQRNGLKVTGTTTAETVTALRSAPKLPPMPKPRPSMPTYADREPRPQQPPLPVPDAPIPTLSPMTGGFGDTEFGARFDPLMEGTLGPDAARPWAVPPPAGFSGDTFTPSAGPLQQAQLETRAGQATGNSPLAGADVEPKLTPEQEQMIQEWMLMLAQPPVVPPSPVRRPVEPPSGAAI